MFLCEKGAADSHLLRSTRVTIRVMVSRAGCLPGFKSGFALSAPGSVYERRASTAHAYRPKGVCFVVRDLSGSHQLDWRILEVTFCLLGARPAFPKFSAPVSSLDCASRVLSCLRFDAFVAGRFSQPPPDPLRLVCFGRAAIRKV